MTLIVLTRLTRVWDSRRQTYVNKKTPLRVNPAHLVAYEPTASGTELLLIGNVRLDVIESPEQIDNKLVWVTQ